MHQRDGTPSSPRKRKARHGNQCQGTKVTTCHAASTMTSRKTTERTKMTHAVSYDVILAEGDNTAAVRLKSSPHTDTRVAHTDTEEPGATPGARHAITLSAIRGSPGDWSTQQPVAREPRSSLEYTLMPATEPSEPTDDDRIEEGSWAAWCRGQCGRQSDVGGSGGQSDVVGRVVGRVMSWAV